METILIRPRWADAGAFMEMAVECHLPILPSRAHLQSGRFPRKRPAVVATAGLLDASLGREGVRRPVPSGPRVPIRAASRAGGGRAEVEFGRRMRFHLRGVIDVFLILGHQRLHSQFLHVDIGADQCAVSCGGRLPMKVGAGCRRRQRGWFSKVSIDRFRWRGDTCNLQRGRRKNDGRHRPLARHGKRTERR